MKIAEGTTHAQLVYDTEHARIEQYANIAGAVTMTFYLNDPVSGAMSEAVSAGGQYTWKTFFLVDGNIVAQRLTVDGSSTVTMKYFILDHLGSVAVVTDDTGAVISGGRNFFDAWGAMRNADGTPDTSCSLPLAARTNTTTTRGYTGQEQMADVCLDNYNARIYDPQIGRFMSADDIVPDAYYSQSYNRYTYVENGPLSFTDPTGHMDPQQAPTFAPDMALMISESMASNMMIVGSNNASVVQNSTQSGTTAGIGESSTGVTTQPSSPQTNGAAVTPVSGLGAQDSDASPLANNPGDQVSYRIADNNGNRVGQLGNSNSTGQEPDAANGQPTETVVVNGRHNPNGDTRAWSADSGRTVYIQRPDGTLEVRRGGTLAWRNNNPGNLRSAPTEIGHNDSLNGRFSIFDSADAGNQAQEDLIFGPVYDGLTISEVIYKYAPPTENDTEAYITDIQTRTGIDRTTLINSLNDQQRNSFMDAIRVHENLTSGAATNYIYNPLGP